VVEGKIDELRENLYKLISENAHYSKILEASQELDDCITQYMSKKLLSTDGSF
jgi:uncharacterized protein YdcH (DUF465 family)